MNLHQKMQYPLGSRKACELRLIIMYTYVLFMYYACLLLIHFHTTTNVFKSISLILHFYGIFLKESIKNSLEAKSMHTSLPCIYYVHIKVASGQSGRTYIKVSITF